MTLILKTTLQFLYSSINIVKLWSFYVTPEFHLSLLFFNFPIVIFSDILKVVFFCNRRFIKKTESIHTQRCDKRRVKMLILILMYYTTGHNLLKYLKYKLMPNWSPLAEFVPIRIWDPQQSHSVLRYNTIARTILISSTRKRTHFEVYICVRFFIYDLCTSLPYLHLI